MSLYQKVGLRFFTKGGSIRSLLPDYRFLDAQTLATSAGGYGVFLRLRGIDEETLTRAELDKLAGSIRLWTAQIPEHITLYSYAQTRRQCNLEHKGANAVVCQRLEQLAKAANFRRIELCCCLFSNPPKLTGKSKTDKAKEQGRRLRDLRQAVSLTKAQFGQLAPEVMNEHLVTEFLSGLLSLEPYLATKRLASRKGVSKQLGGAKIDWTSDGLRIGKRYVEMFSLIRGPSGTRPNLWGELLALDVDLDLCQEWRRAPNGKVRKEVADQEGFLGMWKHRLQTTIVHAVRRKEVGKTAGAAAADKGVDHLGSVLNDIENDGSYYGQFSFIGMVHSRKQEEVDAALPEIHRIIADPSQAAVMMESLGALAAYQAMFPGNGGWNVRRRWLRDTHYANLALVYQPFLGHVRSDDLGGESLTVYETLDRTPFYFDPYYNGVRGLLVVGPTGSGKSMNGNLHVDHDAKYSGFTTVYDVGGSYNSTILSHGGLVTRVGLDGPRFNPFSLEPSRKNVRAIYLLIMLLLRKGGYQIHPSEEKDVFERVRAHYCMEPEVRRLRYFILPDHMASYLAKWIEDGVYGHIFDNEKDELDLADFQAFDFEEIGGEQDEDHRDLIEPMLFWLTYIKECQRQAPENLGRPKHDVFDELWRQIKEPRMWSFILGDLKTARKRLGGVTLLTHHPDDLGDYLALIRNACPMTLFTGDPVMNHRRYAELFQMNEVEIASVESLQPRQVFLKGPWGSKKLVMNLDPKAYAKYTTRPREIKKRLELVAKHGLERGLELFTEEVSA